MHISVGYSKFFSEPRKNCLFQTVLTSCPSVLVRTTQSSRQGPASEGRSLCDSQGDNVGPVLPSNHGMAEHGELRSQQLVMCARLLSLRVLIAPGVPGDARGIHGIRLWSPRTLHA